MDFIHIVLCYLQIVTVLLLPFQFDAFSFSCMTTVARISNTLLNNGGESGHPYLAPEYDVNYGFVIGSFYYVKVSFLYTHFNEDLGFFLNHKWMFYLSKSFSTCTEMTKQFLSLVF